MHQVDAICIDILQVLQGKCRKEKVRTHSRSHPARSSRGDARFVQNLSPGGEVAALRFVRKDNPEAASMYITSNNKWRQEWKAQLSAPISRKREPLRAFYNKRGRQRYTERVIRQTKKETQRVELLVLVTMH